VSRTGGEVEPGLSRAEQKRRRVTWGKRCARVEVPVVLQGIRRRNLDKSNSISVFGPEQLLLKPEP
jgi:hypothetical protein